MHRPKEHEFRATRITLAVAPDDTLTLRGQSLDEPISVGASGHDGERSFSTAF
jgi:hypothetical protein